MVGRGQAVLLTEDLVANLKRIAPYCMYVVRFTTALNKRGDVVDEVHVMMSKKSLHQNLEGNQGRYPK